MTEKPNDIFTNSEGNKQTQDANIDLRCGMPVYDGTSGGQVLQMRYIIERELSSDFMGVKYLAEDTQDKKDIVVWALPIATSEDDEKTRYVSTLSKNLKNLADEHHLNMSDIYSEKDVRYFIIDYVDWCLIEKIIQVKESEGANEEKPSTEFTQEHQRHYMDVSNDAQWGTNLKLPKTAFNLKILAAVLLLFTGIICGVIVSSLFATMKKQDASPKKTDSTSLAKTQKESEPLQWQESALKFEQKGDFTTAAQLYLIAANDGDSNGMYKLGYAYIAGTGLEKSVSEAIYWLEKASEKGNDDAMLELGRIYYTGQDVDKDCNKAFGFFIEAATAGNELAMYNTARMYQQGLAVEVNIPKAIDWYEKAAQRGLTRAMNQLGQIYSAGSIIEQDFSKAKKYYELSATQGDPSGMYNLAVLYHNGIGIEKDIRQAAKWFSKAAEKGDPDAMYQLGLMYENGTNLKKDLGVAVYWYKTAAKAGNETAKQHLEKISKLDN